MQLTLCSHLCSDISPHDAGLMSLRLQHLKWRAPSSSHLRSTRLWASHATRPSFVVVVGSLTRQRPMMMTTRRIACPCWPGETRQQPIVCSGSSSISTTVVDARVQTHRHVHRWKALLRDSSLSLFHNRTNARAFGQMLERFDSCSSCLVTLFLFLLFLNSLQNSLVLTSVIHQLSHPLEAIFQIKSFQMMVVLMKTDSHSVSSLAHRQLR